MQSSTSLFAEDAAVEQYRKAAEKGDAEAQYELGRCYLLSKGVDQNFPEAVKWFRKAAEQGNVRAQYGLGACYFRGKGVPKDKTEAEKWFHKAAAQGHEKAKRILEGYKI